MHSEERVSKLYTVFIDQEQQMRKNNKLYARECLFDYFHLHAFAPERLAGTLLRKVGQARAKGMIAIEEKRKKKRTMFLEEKENKGESREGRKAPKLEETRLYYSILALKILLKEAEPNIEQINRTCEEIKRGLEEQLQLLKIRQEGGIKSTRSSILRRE